MNRLKERGVQHVLLFLSDGLPGMTDAIHSVFPKAEHQVCCVYVSRNIASEARVNDHETILDDFKGDYQTSDQDKVVEVLDASRDKGHKDYPRVVDAVIMKISS